MTAQGYTGTVDFDGTAVTISHNWRGKVGGWKEPREIPTARITRVDFKPATRLTNGHIRFAVLGETHDDVSLDKNLVLFTKKQETAVDEVLTAVKAALRARSQEDADKLSQAEADLLADKAALHRATAVAIYEKHQVTSGSYRSSFLSSAKPIAGATAAFESGADLGRPTLTRIGAGAIIAGPAGAVVGGLFRKNTSRCYVTIEFPDGEAVIVEGPAKDETKLRQFAADVNKIARG